MTKQTFFTMVLIGLFIWCATSTILCNLKQPSALNTIKGIEKSESVIIGKNDSLLPIIKKDSIRAANAEKELRKDEK